MSRAGVGGPRGPACSQHHAHHLNNSIRTVCRTSVFPSCHWRSHNLNPQHQHSSNSVRQQSHTRQQCPGSAVDALKPCSALPLLSLLTRVTSPSVGRDPVRARGAEWKRRSQMATVPPEDPVAANVGREGCTSRHSNCGAAWTRCVKDTHHHSTAGSLTCWPSQRKPV
jgi:hypothetical protein